MGRGLDGYFFVVPVVGGLCSFEGPRARVAPARALPHGAEPLGLEQFPVAIARGKHLFPFRTEQLSLAAPMVLGSQGPGRVGRRRFLHHEPPTRRLVVVNGSARGPGAAGSARSSPSKPAAGESCPGGVVSRDVAIGSVETERLRL